MMEEDELASHCSGINTRLRVEGLPALGWRFVSFLLQSGRLVEMI